MIDKTTIIKARNANLIEYLRAVGRDFVREGRQFRIKGTSGLVVAGNYWYDHARQQGGNALDYLIYIEGVGFKEAVAALVQYSGDTHDSVRRPTREDRRGSFQAPPKNTDNIRALSYLVDTRGIRHDVLSPHITTGRVYEARGTHNCVFTGVDYDTNEVRYAFQRSSLPTSRVMFESSNSDKRYSFSIPGQSDTVLVYESVVDLFSYLSMEPGEIYSSASFLSLGGLSSLSLDNFICKWSGLRDIVFCLDSDSTADEAYARLGAKYASYGYNVSRHSPQYKDWNEQLLRGGHSFPAPPAPWGVLS